MKRKKTTHGEVVRSEVRRLRRQVPFQPFALTLTDGKSLPVRHPFHIAFDPGDPGRQGSMEFVLLFQETRYIGSFDNVVRVSANENGGTASKARVEKRK